MYELRSFAKTFSALPEAFRGAPKAIQLASLDYRFVARVAIVPLEAETKTRK